MTFRKCVIVYRISIQCMVHESLQIQIVNDLHNLLQQQNDLIWDASKFLHLMYVDMEALYWYCSSFIPRRCPRRMLLPAAMNLCKEHNGFVYNLLDNANICQQITWKTTTKHNLLNKYVDLHYSSVKMSSWICSSWRTATVKRQWPKWG